MGVRVPDGGAPATPDCWSALAPLLKGPRLLSVYEVVVLTLTPILVAGIGVLQARAGRSVKLVREQVQNSHAGQPSLREDIDGLKAAVTATDVRLASLCGRFDGLHELVRSQGHQLGELRADLRIDHHH